MVGIGETGCCLAESDRPEEWLAGNWDWAIAQHRQDRRDVVLRLDPQLRADGHIWA